jgi:hypothetical protein
LKTKYIYIVKNTDEYIEKTMKKYKRNMQEICDSIKNQTHESWASKEKSSKPKA